MSRYYLVTGSGDGSGSANPTLNGTETVTLALNASPSHIGSIVGGTSSKKHRIIGHKGADAIISDTPGTAIETTTDSEDGTTTITLPGDLFANYPTTMWDRDADGNKIAIQLIKQDSSPAQDLLTQAIKPEIRTETNENGTVDIQTITIPGEGQSASTVAPPAATQVIIGTSNGGIHTVGGSALNGSGSGTIVLQPSANPRVIVAEDAPVPRASAQSRQNSSEERPHVCDVCNKGFVKREHLTKHLRIHKSDNKRYSCEYCQKAFRDRYELVRHTRRHTGDFPFRYIQ